MDNQKATSYDYKTVRVRRETEAMLCDAYSVLGWEVVDTTLSCGTLAFVNVSFKRDRKIRNKSELLRVQNKVDGVIANVEKLQARKKSAGVPEAITLGTIGALTLGGGMSMVMVLKTMPFMAVGIAVGVVGIGICLLGWLAFNKVGKKRLSEIEPLLENEYAKLSDLCDEALSLEK